MFFCQINCEEICMVFDLWKWGEENIPDGGEKNTDDDTRKSTVLLGKIKWFCMI